MKLMRLAVCAAVFALMGGIVLGEDVAALQAKLAAQEARLNDLQAKMNNVGVASCAAPEAITSLRKNATVTVGGYFNTRYYYKNSELQSKIALGAAPTLNGVTDQATTGVPGALVAGAPMRTISTMSYGDMKLGDTALEFQIDVNEYFDAYIELNFNDSDRGATGPAKNYWMRWKNLCNTGFGVLVGRDNLRFGGIQSYGFFDSFGNGTGDSAGDAFGGWGDTRWDTAGGSLFANTGGMIGFGSNIVPTHTIWNDARTIQVTPYWESQDGKILAELSWFQAIENAHGVGTQNDARGRRNRSINYGFGSFSGRLTWKPIEGLTVMASAMNQHADQKSIDELWGWNGKINKYNSQSAWNTADGFDVSENNFAANLGFEYRPCFFNRLNVFASWTHGWNEGWIKDQDSDSINYGLGIDINESLTWYATGDYLKVTSDHNVDFNKATGWAYETGLKYTLPYGVDFTAAWRHDNIKFKSRGGDTHTKYKSDMFVVHAGFSF